jgi:hypothetical protein
MGWALLSTNLLPHRYSARTGASSLSGEAAATPPPLGGPGGPSRSHAKRIGRRVDRREIRRTRTTVEAVDATIVHAAALAV